MIPPSSLKVKICLIGDSSVGKTSLIRRYVMDIFEDKYLTTLGTKISKKQLIIKKETGEINLIFSIWDVLGQEEFKKIHTMSFKGSKGALLVCDLTRRETLDNIINWNERLKIVTGEVPLVILANKSDLTDQHQFSEVELQEFSNKLNAPFFTTSAKFGDNVIKTFYKIGEFIIDDIYKDDQSI